MQPAAAVDISSHCWGLSKNILHPISRTILLPSYSATVAQITTPKQRKSSNGVCFQPSRASEGAIQ